MPSERVIQVGHVLALLFVALLLFGARGLVQSFGLKALKTPVRAPHIVGKVFAAPCGQAGGIV
jgi:hypothetical protein